MSRRPSIPAHSGEVSDADVRELPSGCRTEAQRLERYAPDAAHVFENCAEALERALVATDAELLHGVRA